jgi:NAD(P)-dependent dehydrogenase (short-subunit alcohol dehydrogenase family)
MSAATDTFARYPSLSARVALVSGGAGGIGAEIVTQLAAQGAHVAFLDIDEAAASALIETVAANGDPRPRFYRCDVRDVSELEQAIERAAAELGPIAVLVNNAGNDERHQLEQTTSELWDERIALNLRHYLFATKAVAPMMRRAGAGSIVNIGSITAHVGFPDLPAYSAANGGIEGLTRGLARDLGADGIRVNCVVPGWILTERQRTLWLTEEAEDRLMSLQCVKELLAPADVARLVLWLAADDSRLCTSQNWIVDGGWM